MWCTYVHVCVCGSTVYVQYVCMFSSHTHTFGYGAMTEVFQFRTSIPWLFHSVCLFISNIHHFIFSCLPCPTCAGPRPKAGRAGPLLHQPTTPTHHTVGVVITITAAVGITMMTAERRRWVPLYVKRRVFYISLRYGYTTVSIMVVKDDRSVLLTYKTNPKY